MRKSALQIVISSSLCILCFTGCGVNTENTSMASLTIATESITSESQDAINKYEQVLERFSALLDEFNKTHHTNYAISSPEMLHQDFPDTDVNGIYDSYLSMTDDEFIANISVSYETDQQSSSALSINVNTKYSQVLERFSALLDEFNKTNHTNYANLLVQKNDTFDH